MKWFVSSGGGRTGPYDDATIVALIREGRLPRGAVLVRGDSAEEVPLERSPFAMFLGDGGTPPAETKAEHKSFQLTKGKGGSSETAKAVGFLVFLLLGFVAFNWHSWTAPSAAEKTQALADAQAKESKDRLDLVWEVAQQSAEKKLKSPGSAKFGGRDVQVLGTDSYRVSGWGDSQNSFGANVRTRFSVTIQSQPDGSWDATTGPTLSQW